METPRSGLRARADYVSERNRGGGQMRTERSTRSAAWFTSALDVICTTPPSLRQLASQAIR